MSRDQALAVAYGVKRRARRNRAEGGDVQPFIAPAENPAAAPRALREFVYDAVAQPVVDAYRAATGKMTEQEQRDFAITAAMGLIGPPAARGAMRPAQSAERAGIRAYHGSPHDFERFDLSRIGSGEGAQVYGHGLYFAENPAVAEEYRRQVLNMPLISRNNARMSEIARELDKFSIPGQYGKYRDPRGFELKAEYDALMAEKTKPGRMYEVNINARPEQFLDYDKPVPQQTLEKLRLSHPRAVEYAQSRNSDMLGQDIYKSFSRDPRRANEALQEIGIPGLKYLDQGSRVAGEGSRNYVVFDDKLIDILRKYGVAALPASGLAAMSTDYQPRADGGRTVNDPAMRVAYEARRRAMGGRNMPMGSQQGSQQGSHRGPISSPVAGRTDHHPMNVDAGSYVLPADHVSSLGQGNTAAGMKVLDEMFGGAGPYGAKAIGLKRMPAVGKSARGKRAFADGGMVPEPVPINAAGGEYVITPDVVTAIGNGNIEEGHRTLDNWVITNRKQHVKTLQKLPGPAKD